MKITPIILSGGSGTRLWPLSTAEFPKQFLSLNSEFSLIQNTIKRLEGIETNDPIVICNEKHRFLVAEQLNNIDTKASIILEPVGKNTAPAIATACFSAIKTDKEAIIAVFPSDHIIQDIFCFQKTLKIAIEQAQQGYLVTFGIKPTIPETGYGYIQVDKNNSSNDSYSLKCFVEKPNLETAKKYLETGDFFWNSGMFVFKANVYLSELKKFNSQVYEASELAFNNAIVDLDFIRLNKKDFERSPSISIDYAVMEKTTKGKVVPLNAGWNDIGSWTSLWEISKKDANQNVFNGHIIAKNVKKSYIYTTNKLIAALDVEDLVIINTKEATLIAKKDYVQNIKELVEDIKNQSRLDLI